MDAVADGLAEAATAATSDGAAAPDGVPAVDRAPSGGVQAVDRALDVLETLAAAATPLGVSAIAQATGLPVGTIHRLLRTLAARGFVRQEASRDYAPGPALFRVGHASIRAIAAPARPYLAQLVEISGETANLAVLEGDHVVYVAQVPSAHRLRMFAEVGRHVLPHSTAVGKVLLADRPAALAEDVIRRTGLPIHTPNTIGDPRAFAAELDRVRARGWAEDDEEEETGVRCFAVPVRDGGRVIAAMSVSGPAARFDGVAIEPLVAQMQKVADAFATEGLRGGAHSP